MGFSKLVLAECPEYDVEKVRMMAVHAFDIFEGSQRFTSLEAALADSTLSVGFSRRKGERRKSFFMDLQPFVQNRLLALTPGTLVSFVFGNERDGLSDSELNLCSIGVSIPTSDAFPSLNVAQAVQIACWEVFSAYKDTESFGFDRSDKKNSVVPPIFSLNRTQVEEHADGIVKSLARIGFFKKSSDDYARRFFRDMIERAQLSEPEAAYFAQIFSKAAILVTNTGKPRRKLSHEKNDGTLPYSS